MSEPVGREITIVLFNVDPMKGHPIEEEIVDHAVELAAKHGVKIGAVGGAYTPDRDADELAAYINDADVSSPTDKAPTGGLDTWEF